MGKYFTRQTRVYYYWLTRMYIVLFTHKNVAETTTIMPLFAHAGLSVCKGWTQDVSIRTYASMPYDRHRKKMVERDRIERYQSIYFWESQFLFPFG